jgi:quercetin dioxygenase-like cupin family protein
MKTLKQFPLMILAVLLLAAAASAQQQPGTGTAGPIVVYKHAAPIMLDGRDYDFVTMVIDFPKGTGFPEHFHGGDVLVTVLSGEITVIQNGSEKIVKTGESWTEKPGVEHEVVNRGASARVTASMVLPRGAAETTFVK